MDKYRRVEKKEEDAAAAAPVEPNEVRITQQGAVRSYVTYANGLFQDKKETTVVVKAMGYAISKAVTVAEVLKHRVVGLHQLTRIGSIETVDVYEPLEEGLDRVEQKRRLPSITITLSLEPLDTSEPGYQAPIAAELVTPQLDEKDLPEKPKRQPKGDKKAKKDKPKKQATTAAAAAAAAGGATSPPPSDRDEDKQVSAEDTKESKPTRGNNSKRGGRGGRGRGRGRGSGDAAGSAEAAPRTASVSPVRKSQEAATDKDDAPAKKRQPRKKRAPGDDSDATKAAADRAAETTADSNNSHGEDAAARETGGGRGRGRGGRGRGRGRGRGGRGDGGRGEGKVASDAAAVVAEA